MNIIQVKLVKEFLINYDKTFMKILLINIPFVFEKKNDISLSHCLGILQIASYLKQNNCNVVILDALQLGFDNIQKKDGFYRVGLTNMQIINKITNDFDLIGISIPFSHLAFLAHELIEKIKDAFPQIPIVIGGVYPSTQPELAIKSKADYIVIGEGEEPMMNILNYLRKNLTVLPDCVIRKNSNLERVKPCFSSRINHFPLAARELIDFRKYSLNPPRNDADGLRSASVITSRGCPYNCDFCSVHPVCGYNWRPITSKKVIEEINHLIDNYDVNNIQIEDDNFTIDNIRTIEILNGIIDINKKKAPLSWQASNGLRIDTLNENIIALISKSNCRYVSVALEHGDIKMLEIMNKKLSLEKAFEIIELLAKYKIKTIIYVIYGYPGENKERFQNALNFYLKLKKLGSNIYFNFFIAQPYPNTKLFEKCVQNGYLPGSLFSDIQKVNRFSTLNKIWIETPDFNKVEVKKRKRLLQKKLVPAKPKIIVVFEQMFLTFFKIYQRVKKESFYT